MLKVYLFLLSIILTIGCQSEMYHSEQPILTEKQKALNFDPPMNSSYFISAAKLENGMLKTEQGMGVVIWASGNNKWILLTNYHIVKGAHNIEICKWAGRPHENKRIDAEIIGSDPELDIALLSFVSKVPCKVAKINLEKVEIGSELIVIGQPVKLLGAVSKGIVSAFWPLAKIGIVIVGDMFTSKGFSGGGAFDMNNRLIGLTMGKTADEKRGFAYILPIERVLPLISGFGFKIGEQGYQSKVGQFETIDENLTACELHK